MITERSPNRLDSELKIDSDRTSKTHRNRSRLLRRSRARFARVLEASEPQKHRFCLSKTSIFAKSHFLFSSALELPKGSILAPKSTPKRLRNRYKSSPETCRENTSIVEFKMTPKWLPNRPQNDSKIDTNLLQKRVAKIHRLLSSK